MIDKTASLPDIEMSLRHNLQKQDPNAKLKLRRMSMGWVELDVMTSAFQRTLSEREEQINHLLQPFGLNLAGYPFYDYTLLTPDEAAPDAGTDQQPLPLWSDVLMASSSVAANADSLEKLTNVSQSEPPLIVTFYSFKGGVGRTTALGVVATVLAATRRVVMVDLDLEAPGLSMMFPSEEASFARTSAVKRGTSLGVLDYLHQRYLTPNENLPPIDDCIQQIKLENGAELYLVPAGEYDEGYVHRLADLDMRVFYRQKPNPIDELIADIKSRLDPEVILIDAPTGFNDASAVALLDLAHLAILCFYPSEQNFYGLRLIIQAIKKWRLRSSAGKPDLRFLLTPIPQVERRQQEIWRSNAEAWIKDLWDGWATAGLDIYDEIPYDPRITKLENLADLPADLLEPYQPLVKVIDANLLDNDG